MYLLLKHVHMTCVLLTFISFFIRGIWMWRKSSLLKARWVKILPHIIDTVLLVTAIALAVYLHLNPVAHPWLMTKIIALIIYIGLGTFAFKHPQEKVRKLAWFAALGVFFYIVCVAVTKTPFIV